MGSLFDEHRVARLAGRHGRVWTIAVGTAAGMLLWLVLPAADTLTHALRAVGIPEGWGRAIVIAAFVVGGIEGASLIMPVLLARSGRSGKERR